MDAAEARHVQSACRTLRELITERAHVRSTICRFVRNYAFKALHWPAKPHPFLTSVAKLPHDLVSLLTVAEWGRDIDRLAAAVLGLVEDLKSLCAGSPSDPSWRYAARFLELGDPGHWIAAPEKLGVKQAEVARRLENLRLSRHPARAAVYRMMREGTFMEGLPEAPPAGVLRTRLCSALAELPWDEEVTALKDELESTLEALRLVTSNPGHIKGVGYPSWYAAAFFTATWYNRTLGERDGFLHEQTLYGFGTIWLNRLWAVPATTPATGQDALDVKNCCDPEYHVYTWGSGQTKDPRSHRFNWGHR